MANARAHPASLAYFAIYAPHLKPPDASEDDEAADAAQVLFYTSREQPVRRDRMLRQVGLAQGVMNFSEMMGKGEGRGKGKERAGDGGGGGGEEWRGRSCNVHSSRKRMITREVEPGYWLHACIDLPRDARPALSKSKPSETKWDYHDGNLHDEHLDAWLFRAYRRFRLLHGSFQGILREQGKAALEKALEKTWSMWVRDWDLDGEEGFEEYAGELPASPLLDQHGEEVGCRLSEFMESVRQNGLESNVMEKRELVQTGVSAKDDTTSPSTHGTSAPVLVAPPILLHDCTLLHLPSASSQLPRSALRLIALHALSLLSGEVARRGTLPSVASVFGTGKGEPNDDKEGGRKSPEKDSTSGNTGGGMSRFHAAAGGSVSQRSSVLRSVGSSASLRSNSSTTSTKAASAWRPSSVDKLARSGIPGMDMSAFGLNNLFSSLSLGGKSREKLKDMQDSEKEEKQTDDGETTKGREGGRKGRPGTGTTPRTVPSAGSMSPVQSPVSGKGTTAEAEANLVTSAWCDHVSAENANAEAVKAPMNGNGDPLSPSKTEVLSSRSIESSETRTCLTEAEVDPAHLEEAMSEDTPSPIVKAVARLSAATTESSSALSREDSPNRGEDSIVEKGDGQIGGSQEETRQEKGEEPNVWSAFDVFVELKNAQQSSEDSVEPDMAQLHQLQVLYTSRHAFTAVLVLLPSARSSSSQPPSPSKAQQDLLRQTWDLLRDIERIFQSATTLPSEASFSNLRAERASSPPPKVDRKPQRWLFMDLVQGTRRSTLWGPPLFFSPRQPSSGGTSPAATREGGKLKIREERLAKRREPEGREIEALLVASRALQRSPRGVAGCDDDDDDESGTSRDDDVRPEVLETFARTNSGKAWVVSKAVKRRGRGCEDTEGRGRAEGKVFLVVQGKEVSLMDADNELRRLAHEHPEFGV